MSRLYLLEAREDQESHGKRGVDPWEPWYDKTFSFVGRADSEEEARRLAQEGGESETGPHYGDHPEIPAWIDPQYSTCEELLPEGKHGIIIANTHAT